MSAETSALVDIRRVGVIGAGQMGNGIAHVCSLAGYDVVLVDEAIDDREPNCEGLARRQPLVSHALELALVHSRISPWPSSRPR